MPAPNDIDAMALVTRTAALAIERYRAQQALRESNERLRGMFQRMQEGFFLREAMRDAAGRVTDFRFLEVNPAFEQQSGLRAGHRWEGRRVGNECGRWGRAWWASN